MSVLIRSNFQDIFDNALPFIDAIYMQAKDLDESKAPWRKIFHMKKSDKQFENVTGFSGFGQFTTVGEAEDIPLMTISQLYDKKFTHTKWAGAWQVSEEMEDDDQYELVSSLAKAFARSFRFTKEVNFANVLNNGFTTELAADGAAFFATHTLLNASTIVNNVATDYSVAAAQTMWNHFASLVDDQGIRINLKPACIYANPAMRWVIGEVNRSDYKPSITSVTGGSSDINAINVLSEETLEEVYWPEITDTDAWYVFARPEDVNGFGLRAYDRQPFTTSTDFDVRNLTMISVGRGRWSRGVVDFRQGYGSTGAG